MANNKINPVVIVIVLALAILFYNYNQSFSVLTPNVDYSDFIINFEDGQSINFTIVNHVNDRARSSGFSGTFFLEGRRVLDTPFRYSGLPPLGPNNQPFILNDNMYFDAYFEAVDLVLVTDYQSGNQQELNARDLIYNLTASCLAESQGATNNQRSVKFTCDYSGYLDCPEGLTCQVQMGDFTIGTKILKRGLECLEGDLPICENNIEYTCQNNQLVCEGGDVSCTPVCSTLPSRAVSPVETYIDSDGCQHWGYQEISSPAYYTCDSGSICSNYKGSTECDPYGECHDPGGHTCFPSVCYSPKNPSYWNSHSASYTDIIDYGGKVSEECSSINENCVQDSCGVSICLEDWSCQGWDVCSNSLQTRTCVDLNACGTLLNKPDTSQACVISNNSIEDDTISNGTIGGGGGENISISCWEIVNGECLEKNVSVFSGSNCPSQYYQSMLICEDNLPDGPNYRITLILISLVGIGLGLYIWRKKK